MPIKKRRSTWIPVEERWPAICTDILFTDGSKIYKGWLECYEPLEDPVFFNDEWGRTTESWPDNVTHWMPLPELPVDEPKPQVVLLD